MFYDEGNKQAGWLINADSGEYSKKKVAGMSLAYGRNIGGAIWARNICYLVALKFILLSPLFYSDVNRIKLPPVFRLNPCVKATIRNASFRQNRR